MARIPVAGRRPRWTWIVASTVVAVALAVLGARSLLAGDDDRPPAPAPDDVPVPVVPTATDPAATPREGAPGAPTVTVEPTSFPTPEAAAKAMFDAFERNDDAGLRALVGSGNEDLVSDGQDPVRRTQRAALAAAAKAKLTLDRQPDGRVVLVVGTMAYPLALPLVERDGAWRVDAASGRQELLVRRIGEHELEAVGICLAYADAQVQYASKDRDGDGVREYAQRLVSTPGTQDGLSWETADGEEESPAGPDLRPLREALNADATARAPFDGYLWRILTAQGPAAPGGAYSSVINGNLIAGFALVAVPAVYRNTGVMTFLTSHHGKVYEKDLGPDTLRLAAALTTFDPDPSWRVVDDATLHAAARTSPDDAPYAEADAVEATPVDLGPAGTTGPSDDGDDIPAGTAPRALPAPSAPTAPCPVK